MRFVVLVCLVWLSSAAARAHVNSTHVYEEGQAGPWLSAMIVHLPPVVPAEASLQLRLLDLKEGEDVQVHVREVPPSGEEHAPPWREAEETSPSVFEAPVPIIVPTTWRVEARITGARGEGLQSVTIRPQQTLPGPMERGLGLALSALTLLLCVSAWRILRGLGQEASLPGDEQAGPKDIRRGLFFGVFGLGYFLTFCGFIGFFWYQYEAGFKAHLIDTVRAELRVERPPIVAGVAQPTVVFVRDGEEPLLDLVSDEARPARGILLRLSDFSRFASFDIAQLRPGLFQLPLQVESAGAHALFLTLPRTDGSVMARRLEFVAQPGQYSLGAGPFPPLGQAGTRQQLVGNVVAQLDTPTEWGAGEFVPLTVRLEGVEISDVREARLTVVSGDGQVFSPVDRAGAASEREAGGLVFPHGFPESGLHRLFLELEMADGSAHTTAFDVTIQ